MTLRLLISLSLLLAALAAHAQTAEEFFNSGAQFYISTNIPAALEKVESGRKLYPDDVKLKKLEELLKQQNQQQQQQNQQNQQNQKNQQNQQQQQQQNQQSQQNQKQGQNQQNQPEQQKNQQSSSQKQQNKQSEAQKEQGQTSAAQEMSPEQAKRLLDAQKGDEQFLQLKPQKPPENQKKPIKDW